MKSIVLVLAASVALVAADPVIKNVKKDFNYNFEVEPGIPEINFDASAALAPLSAFKQAAFDLALPAAGFVVMGFAAYIFVSLAIQVGAAIMGGKLTLFNGALAWLNAMASGFKNKFSSDRGDFDFDFGEIDGAREGRNAAFASESQLLSLLSGFADALNKYD